MGLYLTVILLIFQVTKKNIKKTINILILLKLYNSIKLQNKNNFNLLLFIIII